MSQRLLPDATRTQDEQRRIAKLQRLGWHQPQALVSALQDRPWIETIDGTFEGLPGMVWHTVYAEVLLRTGAASAAMDSAREAISASMTGVHNKLPDRHSLLLPTLAVWTDLGLYLGTEPAHQPHACSIYALLAEIGADPERVIMAKALRAITIFHHYDADRGHYELQLLLLDSRIRPGAEMTRMLTAGLAAMTSALAGHRQVLRDKPAHLVPAVGGHLHPHVANPPLHYLTTRIQRHSPQRTPTGDKLP